MELVWENASRPGAVSCVGAWRSRGKAITIVERDGQMVLEMGSDAPMLELVPASEGAEVWPMQWRALRMGGESKDPLYIIELPMPTSTRLFVRRPVGDGVIEFVRAGLEGAGGASPTEGSQKRAASGGEDRYAARSRSRSRSSRGGEAKDAGQSGFLPGDWTCDRCNFHNFARNLSCKNCGASKPKGAGTAEGPGDREGLVLQVKRGQRESQAFKQRWWDYCDRKGNGYYDPVRHDSRFLEEFLEQERKRGARSGRSASRSQSRSASKKSRKRSSPTPRSASGKRQKSPKRRRRRRHRKRKASRRERRKRHKRSRSSESSSSVSGRPSRDVAVKAAERVVAEAEKAVELARSNVSPNIGDRLREAEDEQREEVDRVMEKERKVQEEDIQKRLREQEQKLQEEKSTRLREAEQRLDKAITARLREAESKLRKEAKGRIEEAVRAAGEAARETVSEQERKIHADAAAKVEVAEDNLRKARTRLASLREGAKRQKSPDKSRSRSRSTSASSSASESEE
uniref:RanBP2-type domain-containing protein n=1 Tax=Noctiluca scintillans TaxID=2966 RepID=A0A7S1FEY2_NOCSC|mmetsp:Transcript_55359/g.147797  ORF Transcript_55359/g.147797 Transcript_55359/m.147797 type:complete len:515 (+) Transcript_55359:93-1637(+)